MVHKGGEKPRIVAIASGKGGVGKTSVSVNLAWALAEAGMSVLILDADLGLSNVDILLNMNPPLTLEDVLFRGVPMEEAIVSARPGVDILSGSSGVQRMAELDRARRGRLVREFAKLDRYDYILVDNSPGITSQIVSLCLSSRDIVILATPEATAITDAYALIKVLKESGLWWSPMLLINRARSPEQARKVFDRIKATAQKYMKMNCSYLGCLPEDRAVARAALERKPVVEIAPGSGYTRALVKVAASLVTLGESRKGHQVTSDGFMNQYSIRLQQLPRVAAFSGGPSGSAVDTSLVTRAMEELGQVERLLRELGTGKPVRSREGVVDLAMKSLIQARNDLLRFVPGYREETAAKAEPASQPAGRLSSEPRPGVKPAAHFVAPKPATPSVVKSALVPQPGQTTLAPMRMSKPQPVDRDVLPSLPVMKRPARKRALLVCPEQGLREVIFELMDGMDVEVDMGDVARPVNSDMYDFCVFSMSRPGQGVRQWFRQNNKVPIVVLEGFETRKYDFVTENLNSAIVLKKPFNIDELVGVFRGLSQA